MEEQAVGSEILLQIIGELTIETRLLKAQLRKLHQDLKAKKETQEEVDK